MSKLFQLFIPILILFLSITTNAQWFYQNPLPQGNDLQGITYINSNHAVAIGLTGCIVKTTDYGESWICKNSGTTKELRGVSFIDTYTGQ